MGSPIVVRAPLAIPRGEAGFWKIMTKLDRAGPWAPADVAWHADTNKGTISEFCNRLRLGGYIEVVGQRPNPQKHLAPATLHRIVKPVIVAPRLRKDGTELPEPDFEKIWRAVKMSRDFSARDIVAALAGDGAPPPLVSVRVYLVELKRVGIIARADGGRRRGKNGGQVEARYRLVRNIGARAPRVLRGKVVFDPNAEKVLGAVEVSECSS